MLSTAVLLIVFNRPRTTQIVFDAIRAARPSRLYIAADGPRFDKKDESILCSQTRSIVTAIDWPCELITLFQEENLGCKKAVSRAIDWFFEHENEGIILEDDTVPMSSFFGYCEELLGRYKDNDEIMMVSGSNLISSQFESESSYFYTRYIHIWGWATWRRAWQKYDVDMSCWPEWRERVGLLDFFDGNSHLSNYWTQVFNSIHSGHVDTWDYQWVYACWKNYALSITPRSNLIQNIGFGHDATHTAFGAPLYVTQSSPSELVLPLVHPLSISRNIEADQISETHVFGFSTISPSEKLGKHMDEKTIEEIHLSKVGKLSDKWASYLPYYDHLLSNWRKNSITMLEIGVQNGGSLETWAEYFSKAELIIGCDIDPKCGDLVYDDARIHVVIGDACKLEAFQKITKLTSSFDLVIDDGSHTSTDILNAFINYFPLVKPGGVYIVEDACCLYMNEFDGGLLHDRSATAFFKKLIDVINFQFWRDQANIQTYLRTFFTPDRVPKFILDGEAESIEFRNSIITIKKSINPGHEKLGERLKVGSNASVQNWGS